MRESEREREREREIHSLIKGKDLGMEIDTFLEHAPLDSV